MKNIVLTGGPCAGKTTALAVLKECLEERGYKVFIVSESATELINKGIRPFGENAISLYDFQKIIIPYQLNKEAIIRAKARLFKKSVILYDRGAIDNKSYLDDVAWNSLLNETGYDELKLMNRYDMIIHLVTAACGKEEFYTTSNNSARSEDISSARERDAATLNAYIGHHNLKVIDNSTDFREKIDRVKNCILSFLGEPTYCNNTNKFIVDLNNSDLDKVKGIGIKSYIEQVYLKSEENVERKLRKRMINGEISYYLITKTYDNNNERKICRVISRAEYLYYLIQKDKKKNPIKKIRYSFKYNNEIYNLDIFADNNYAILENETTKKLTDSDLPKFLNIVGIENNKETTNSTINSKKLK